MTELTKAELRALAVEHGLDVEFVRSRYRRGKRGADLVAPRMTLSANGKIGAKHSPWKYKPAGY